MLNIEHRIKIYLTNLKQLWVEDIYAKNVLERFKESNPLFQVTVEECVEEVIKLVDHVIWNGDIEIKIRKDKILEMNLEGHNAQFKLYYKFILLEADFQMFFREITLPMIQTIKHLEAKKSSLNSTLQKKDRELEEYKLEKGSISRQDLITEKYEDNSKDADTNLLLNLFNSEDFWTTFSQNHACLATSLEIQKVDHWNSQTRKRKVYSSDTVIKKGKGINFTK